MLQEFQNDTRRVNCKTDEFDVYIGRPSEFGNPYTHIKTKKTLARYIVKSREEAISKYEEYLRGNKELLQKIQKLRGKRISCWCDLDKSCHGDVIIKILRETE